MYTLLRVMHNFMIARNLISQNPEYILPTFLT